MKKICFVALVSLALVFLGCSGGGIAKDNEIILKIEVLSEVNVEPSDNPAQRISKIHDARQQSLLLLTEYKGADKWDLQADVEELFRLRETEIRATAATGNGLGELHAYESKKIEITGKYYKH